MTTRAESAIEIVAESWLSRRWSRWHALGGKAAQRSLLAMADQAVVSGTRFLVCVVIGRACGPEELGNYTLAFSLYCLAVCVQESLVTLPFTIYRNGFQDTDRRAYSGSVFTHFLVLAGICAAVFGVSSAVMGVRPGSSNFAPVLGMLAISLPFGFLMEFARRFTIAGLDLTTTFVIDATMATVQIIGLALLAWTGMLSAALAYSVMGAAAAVTGIAWLATSRGQFAFDRTKFAAHAISNWRFGRWVLASQLALVARFSAVPWLLVVQLGTTATGIFAACETVIQLANPLLIAVANIMVPNAAKAFAEGGASEVRRIVLRSTVVLGLVTGLLSAAFMLLGSFFVVTVYGEAYLGRGAVIAVLGAGVVAEGLGLSAANGLWAIDRPKANLVANVFAVACTLVITIVTLNSWGIVGAACGATAGRMAASALQIFAFLKATETTTSLEVAS